MNRLTTYWQDNRRYLWLLAAPLLIVILQLLPEPSRAWLSYQLAAAHAGESYRAITGQWVHFTWYHTFYNACALGLTGWVLWRDWRARVYGLALVWVLLWVAGWLWFTLPPGVDYRGASGAVYGMVALGLWRGRHTAPVLYPVALALLSGKIIFEQTPLFDANYLAEQLGGEVAAGSHLAGLLGALSFAGCEVVYRRFFPVTGAAH